MSLLFRTRPNLFAILARSLFDHHPCPLYFRVTPPLPPPLPRPHPPRAPGDAAMTLFPNLPSKTKRTKYLVKYIKSTITSLCCFCVLQRLQNLRLNAKTIHTLLTANLFDKLTTVAFLITRKLAVKPARIFFQTVIIKTERRIISETSLCSPFFITKQSAHVKCKEARHFKTATKLF